MLEIIALWALTSRIGKMVEQKGYKSGWYKVLTVLLWVGGEVIGALLGATDRTSSASVYIIALLGAAVGAAIAYAIASSVKPKYSVPQPGASNLASRMALKLPGKSDTNYITCSVCGQEQWSGYHQCQKCGATFASA